ncbi:bifunctional 4-hydroxy-3-methylbut-2-enyl diphosphate reductase/30S ribosomal protein S1 [Sporanaerobacter acetigenes]|uniref:bifunctional 4-hydroxy-3-methylbut-2-enyl diphosphate reductase/30S ribosomal protein S1 n=1 Tax=Sporanaerobacter acetigenes TaxID=165813 RepID=UPI001F362F8A|nr:bifunctional 4-hydroxy-3-methylbut-2-enyl diphosphate reductase/30S ribosomal protein S1 [Sporanaerobacter acetigenes]
MLAKNAGFCFGVKRAVDKATETLMNSNESIYSLGPLVHNKQVVEKFNRQGLKVIENPDEIKLGRVIIRAHGVPYGTYEKLSKNNIDIIDCTCPYVKRIHDKVKEYLQKGYKIVIIGDKNHPEVIGVNGWCNNEGIVINDEKEAETLPHLDKICIVSQTTNRQEKFKALSEIISKKADDVKIYNTICNATYLRQESCKELAKTVEAMIVIGGYHSSNTNKLVEISKKYCNDVFHIETLNDLPIDNMPKFQTIGITAGASTPDWIIKEVIDKMENMNNEEMIKAIEESLVRLHRGDIVKGKVIALNNDEVMVNLGYKSDGIIPKEELSNDPSVSPQDLYKEGEEIEVYVISLDDGEGNVLLSTKILEAIKGWDELEQLYNKKDKVSCKVVDVVKGGVIAIVKGLNGFIPASLISMNYVEDLNVFKDKSFDVKIIDFDRSKKRIILSRKELEKEEIEKKQNEVWNNLEIGEMIDGKVMRITDFGAFVDIGGIDGLIHISDMSWNRIKHPSEVVHEGENVKVQILNFDRKKGRVSLGLKQTMPEPWEVFVKEYKVGDIAEGTVVNMLDFGAFIRLDVGVDGLVHVSQISNEHVNRPADKLSLGEKVTVKIMDIKEDERKISLSMKEVMEDVAKEDEIATENKEMDVTVGDIIKDK